MQKHKHNVPGHCCLEPQRRAVLWSLPLVLQHNGRPTAPDLDWYTQDVRALRRSRRQATTPPPYDSICHLDTREAWISVKHGSLLPNMWSSKNKMEIPEHPEVPAISIQQYFLVVKVLKTAEKRNESIPRYPNAHPVGLKNFCHPSASGLHFDKNSGARALQSESRPIDVTLRCFCLHLFVTA